MLRCILLMTLFLFSSNLPVQAGDWPMFRGPLLNGIAENESAPTTWSETENVLWKAPLPSPGNGSPIVSQGLVFVTAMEDAEGLQRGLYCFDATTGEKQWSRVVAFDKVMPTHKTNPHAPTTPASDGERVVVWHGSAGLHCYDHQGKEQWSQNLGEFRHMWGFGSSPILFEDKVILHTGPGEKVFVVAFDLKTGKELWRQEEPQNGNGERNAAGEYMGSWSTPMLFEENGKPRMLVVHCTRVVAYDPTSGEIIWFCHGVGHDKGDLAYSSPVIHDGICFLTGGFRGPALAVRLGGSGDVTETHRLWRQEKQPQSIGSGVVIDGFVYRPNAGPGTLQCINIKTGESLWEERAPGTMWASVVLAGGLLYATNQDAMTTVFKPNPSAWEEVARNKLPGSTNSTPAIAGGHVFVRTNEALWCLGKK